MITRERLEELAKKCIPVYAVTRRDVFKIETSDPKIGFIGNFVNWVVELNGISRRLNAHLNDIYETKEEAEFALEFQNITRTETLNLPTWEKIPFERQNYYVKKFTIKNNYDYFGRLVVDDNTIRVMGLVQGILFEEYFNEVRSKENYIEACKIAKKLFLGE